MYLKSTFCTILLLCTALARAQATEKISELDDFSEPRLADPVAFMKAGRGQYISITSTQYEAYRQHGEMPKLAAEDTPKIPADLSATSLNWDEQDAILRAHNDYRALHGSPPLTWNNDAAAFANSYLYSTQNCVFRHSGGKFGENLAYGYNDFPAAIKAWYDEVRFYNYNNPGFSGQTGHFTQVVWASTRSVGCAIRRCSGYSIYICEYDPPGNIMAWGGRPTLFIENVHPRP